MLIQIPPPVTLCLKLVSYLSILRKGCQAYNLKFMGRVRSSGSVLPATRAPKQPLIQPVLPALVSFAARLCSGQESQAGLPQHVQSWAVSLTSESHVGFCLWTDLAGWVLQAAPNPGYPVMPSVCKLPSQSPSCFETQSHRRK